MKKWLLILGSILFFVLTFLYWQFNYPDDATIEREVKAINPKAEIVSAEMIFDGEPRRVVTYVVKYKEPPRNEVRMHDFSLKQHWNFKWHWCNDQTERKCT
jgi:hypothetical protein